MARKSETSVLPESPLMAAFSAPAPSGIEVSEPKRLIDIELFRFGIVRSQVIHMRDATPLVRSITIDEDGAKALMRALVKALI